MIENPINRYVCECVRLGRIDRGLSMRQTAVHAGIRSAPTPAWRAADTG